MFMTLKCLFRAIFVAFGRRYKWLQTSGTSLKFLRRLCMKEHDRFIYLFTASRLESFEFLSALTRFESPSRHDTSCVEFPCRLNTFTAIVDLSRFNNSCLKSPSSTLVDLTFQSRALRSFSLNQLRNLSL